MPNEINTDASFLEYVEILAEGYEDFFPSHLFNWDMKGVNCATEDYTVGSTSEIAFTFETDMPIEVGTTVGVTTFGYGTLLFTVTDAKKKKTLQNRFDITCSNDPRTSLNPDSVIEKSDLSRLPANYTLKDLALFAGGINDGWDRMSIPVNANYVVNQNWWYQGITYRQLYQWCCQLGGINDAGTLWPEVWSDLSFSGVFSPTEPDSSNCLFFNSNNVKSIDLANYQTPVVDKIWFGNESTDVGFSLGTGEQTMMFPSNPLINPNDTSFLNPLYNRLHALQSYTPMRVETFQNYDVVLPPGYHFINGKIYSDEELIALPASTSNRVANTYRAIWGVTYSNEGVQKGNVSTPQYGRNNLLRQYQLDSDASSLTLTAEHLRKYVSLSEPGSFLQLSTSIGDSADTYVNYFIVDFDSDGLFVIENRTTASTVDYYKWSDFVTANSSYSYIFFIGFPIGSGVPDTAPSSPSGHDITIHSGSALYIRPYEFSNADNVYITIENDYTTKTITYYEFSHDHYGGSVSGVWSGQSQSRGWNVVIYEGKCLYIKSQVPLGSSSLYDEKIVINGETYTASKSDAIDNNNYRKFFYYGTQPSYSPGRLSTEYDYVDYSTYLIAFNHEEINIFCTLWEYLNWPGANETSITKACPWDSTMNVLKSYSDQGIGVPVSSLKTMLDTYGAPGMLVHFSTNINQVWGSTTESEKEGAIIVAHWDDDNIYFLDWNRNQYGGYDPATVEVWQDYFNLEYRIQTWADFNSNCTNANLTYINAMLLPESFTPETQPTWNGYYLNPIPVGGVWGNSSKTFSFTPEKLAWNYIGDWETPVNYSEQYTWMAYTDDDKNTYYCPIFNWEASPSGIILEGTGNKDRRTENSYLAYDLRTAGKYESINSAINSAETDVSGVTTAVANLNIRVGNVEAAVGSKVDSSDYNGNTIISKINANGVTQTISPTRVDLSNYVTDSEYIGSEIIGKINAATTGLISSSKVDMSGYTPSISGDSIITQINAVGVTNTINANRLNLTGYAKTNDLATVATSGSYNDLINKPTLATVAISGSYNDLIDVPTTPIGQVQADWAQSSTTSVDYIKNKPTNLSDFTNDEGFVGITDISDVAERVLDSAKTTYDNALKSFEVPANKHFMVDVFAYKPSLSNSVMPTSLALLNDSGSTTPISNGNVLKEVLATSMPSSDRISFTYLGCPSVTTTYYISLKTASNGRVGYGYTGWYM